MVSSRWRPVTRHSICSSARAVLAFGAVIVALGAQPAVADDRASVEAGRAAGRAILLLQDPRGCSIAVLRERCIADVEAFLHGRGDNDFKEVPKVGPHPASGLRAFVTNGDRDAFDFALSWINSRIATAARWQADPRDAALYDAGVLDVSMASASRDQGSQMFGAVPAADLALHAEKIPDGALPLDVAPLRALHMTRPNALDVLPFAKELVRALRTSVPPPPLAPVPSGDGPAADAALGLAAATMSELLDAWQWGQQNDAQLFAAALADRLDAIVSAPGRPFVGTFRTKVRPGDAFDRAGAASALTSAVAVLDAAIPVERRQRIALGSAAAQLAYNAANTHSVDAARNLLVVLSSADVLDAAIPGWQASRAEGASLGPSQWLAQHAYALRLIGLIQKANGS